MRIPKLVAIMALSVAARVVSAQPAAAAPAAPLATYVGSYELSDASGTTPLRVFVSNATLMGQLRTNAPTRLRPLGGHRFQPEEATDFTVSFTVTNGVAVAVVVEAGTMRMAGSRVGGDNALPLDSSTTGPLFDALQRADSLLFDASFATCDYRAAAAFLAPDVEFYHDKTGFHAGDVVRDDFRRLTTNCPAKQGVRREVVPGSLHVYPIKDYGAVQMGEHVFRERGSTTSTAARFVHLWREQNGRWVLTRVMSFDHLPVPVR